MKSTTVLLSDACRALEASSFGGAAGALLLLITAGSLGASGVVAFPSSGAGGSGPGGVVLIFAALAALVVLSVVRVWRADRRLGIDRAGALVEAVLGLAGLFGGMAAATSLAPGSAPLFWGLTLVGALIGGAAGDAAGAVVKAGLRGEE